MGRLGQDKPAFGWELEPERFLPWAAGRSSGWWRWARCCRRSGARRAAAEEVALGALLQTKWRSARCYRRSGARRVAAEDVVLGALQKKKKSLRRCCAKDERQMLEDPAAARETNEHSG